MATSVERTRTLQASAEKVWAVLADFDGISGWAPNVAHSSLLSDTESGPGTSRRVQVGRNALVETVVTWEPTSTIAYRIEGLPKRLGALTNQWDLVAAGERTQVTLTSTVDAGARPPARLIERLVTKKMGSTSDEMLDGLVAHLTGKETS